MRYVIKDRETGEYIRGESWWNKSRTTDIHKAKLYHRKGQAEQYPKRWRGMAGAERLIVVPVTIAEAGA